jgi:hypothetical protein
MSRAIRSGDCVKLHDGRIGRVRGKVAGEYKVRVRRITSNTHQFLMFLATELTPIDCPKGWMSPEGYNRYLKTTLVKLRKRLGARET